MWGAAPLPSASPHFEERKMGGEETWLIKVAGDAMSKGFPPFFVPEDGGTEGGQERRSC